AGRRDQERVIAIGDMLPTESLNVGRLRERALEPAAGYVSEIVQYGPGPEIQFWPIPTRVLPRCPCAVRASVPPRDSPAVSRTIRVAARPRASRTAPGPDENQAFPDGARASGGAYCGHTRTLNRRGRHER